MTEFDDLKANYIAAIQMGIEMGLGKQNCKIANYFLHKLCEMCIDSSNYNDCEKRNMKQELEIIKETLSKQIEVCCQSE